MTAAFVWPALVIVAIFAIYTCFAEPAMGPTLAPGVTLQGRFIQERQLKGLSSPLKSEGSFLLAPGKGLVWRTELPIQTVTVITPAEIRQIINGSEVQRVEAARVPFVSRFYDMLNGALLGDWSAMRHDFSSSNAARPTALARTPITCRSGSLTPLSI